METIGNYDFKKLYDEAIRLRIPFHKWYAWIEKELNLTYINLRYENKTQPRQIIRLVKSIRISRHVHN